MPIYAYACLTCGHSFDSLQRMSDPDPAECPACGAPEVKRQLTAPSFRLAGAGWYETDFKKDGDRKRNIAGDGAESKSVSSEGGSKDTSAKPEATGKGESAPAKDAGASTSEGKSAAKPESTAAPKAAAPAAPAARNE